MVEPRGPFLPFMPNVKRHIHEFEEAVYREPHGQTALAKAWLINPDIPEIGAGGDQTPLGAGAIDALAGIRNAADEMALAAQQAQAIARNTKIASVRSYEALKSYQAIVFNEHNMKDPIDPLTLPAPSVPFPPATNPQPEKITKRSKLDKEGKLTTENRSDDWQLLVYRQPYGDGGKAWDNKAVSASLALPTEVFASFFTGPPFPGSSPPLSDVDNGLIGASDQVLKLPGAQLPPHNSPDMMKIPKRPRSLRLLASFM